MGPAGELPLDPHIDQAIALPAIMWLLMPKPKGAMPEKSTSTTQPANQPTKRPWEHSDKKGKDKGGRPDKAKNKKLSKIPMPLRPMPLAP